MIRSILFQALYWLTSIFFGVLAAPLLLLPTRGPMMGWIRLYTRAMTFWMRHVAGVKVTVRGRENIPDGPCIIAAKHQSAFETFLFPALRSDAVFVIKKELLRAPLVGWYLSRAGQIAIDRAANAAAIRQMLAAAKERTEEGLALVIFPEGTRVPFGATAPIRPGVAALYMHLGLPVVPVTLDSGLYWPRNSFLRRRGTVQVRFGAAIAPGLKRRAFEERLAAALAEPPLPLAGTRPPKEAEAK